MNSHRGRRVRSNRPFILAILVAPIAATGGIYLFAVRTKATGAALPLRSVAFEGGLNRSDVAVRDPITTSREIRSLRVAGVPANDPVIVRAVAILSSCQLL